MESSDLRPQASEEKTPTEQPDPVEPAGDQDPANEEEAQEAAEEAASDEPSESAEAAAPPEPEDELTALTRERDEYLALAQRTQADFENFRKRAAKEAAAAGERDLRADGDRVGVRHRAVLVVAHRKPPAALAQVGKRRSPPRLGNARNVGPRARRHDPACSISIARWPRNARSRSRLWREPRKI